MQPAQGLLFNSVQYAVFLAVVVALYWSMARFLPAPFGVRARQGLLLVTSYLFYATWDWRFCLLLALVTAVNYVVGRQLGRTSDPGRRKVLLLVALGVTLGILGVFKYLGFFVDSATSLLHAFGIQADWVLTIALPLGISFFTLHAVSYSIDVYRRELEPTDDLLVFGIFVAYFPQLLAGPLTRGKRMLPQFSAPRPRPERIRVLAGLELILIGIFQKVAIADALAPATSQLFAASTAAPGTPNRNFLMLLLGMMASVVQFVLDYAGYSNIARGSSKLLGIELPYNFRQPITRSRNMQDYWRRHNMTLMAWFRDYVLRPLRRRNDTALRSSLLLVLVFTLSGLWHVASRGWVVWGLFIGVWVAAEIQVNRYREADRVARLEAELADAAAARAAGRVDVATPVSTRKPRTLVTQIGASIYCVAVLGFSMVLFRSVDLRAAMAYYGEAFSFTWTPLDWDTVLLFVYAVVAVIIVDFREHRMEVVEGRPDPPTVPRALTWGAMIVLIVVFSGGVLQPFVYFQF